MGAMLLSYSERRLARLFRRAALQHIRHELSAAGATLGEAVALLESDPRLAAARGFVREWAEAVESERKGRSLQVAPAAWIHLSQELASVLESGGEWQEYLESRWRFESGQLGWVRRTVYGVLGAMAFTLSGAVALLLVRHASSGSWEGLGVGTMSSAWERSLALTLLLGRVAGAVYLAEHGLHWARRAVSGRADVERAIFLGRPDGLSVANPPSN